MSITILDGKKVSEDLLSTQINRSEFKRPPYLYIITVGEDDSSKVYVKNKLKKCNQCGIVAKHKKFKSNISFNSLKGYIMELNYSNNIDGIIIQQPLPKHLKGIEQYVDKDKDVDGFTDYNLGTTLTSHEGLQACTPKGILYLLKQYNINLKGKVVCVVGRSNIVGKPLIGLLLQQNATVISCNSHTENLKSLTKQCDILIVAIGKSKFISRDYLSSKCMCIIDVGINKDKDNRLCGDVDFQDVVQYWKDKDIDTDEIDRYITPVPGGVGPMTVASLVQNVNIAYHNNIIKQLKIGDR